MYTYIIYDIWYKVLVLVWHKVYLVNIYNIYNAIYMMLYIYMLYIYICCIYIYIYICCKYLGEIKTLKFTTKVSC